MKLLIVESPAKAKTLEKYLGKDFKVVSSYGHIRSLPSVRDAVKPESDFQITYEPIIRAKDTIKKLAENFKKAETIYLATDPDREGEAICWHILETMKNKKSLNKSLNIKRIVFHEITKSAVVNAIDNPRELDKDLIHAQQARQALDYLVGFTLSPVLWRKLPGSKSAGRVQSVALKLLCERENERDKFREQEYWTIDSIFSKNNKDSFNSQLYTHNGKKLEKLSINNENQAKDVIKNIKTLNYKVSSIKKKEILRKPTAPFITSTLIQEASRKLNFSAQKTMVIAQKLYEGIQVKGEINGLITYMRTDSVTISQEAIKNIISRIKSYYGSNYLPKSPILYKSKSKNAQEAHEAIRPTDFNNNPSNLKDFLDNDQYRLYELIWKRTIASQMANAKLESVTIEISSQDNKNIFKSTGSTIIFDGFYKIYKEGIDNEENEKKNNIPKLQEGDALNLDKITPNQHFTQPPPRYTEASLVKKMEELGIGRPSTYPKIISILVEREYAKILQKRFIPEAKGRLVDAFLNKFFDKYIDYDFTANLENDLDDIANGKKKWKEVLANFWILFKDTSDKVLEIKNIDVINEVEKLLLDYIFNTDDKNEISKLRKCSNCKNGELGLKTGKFGAFIGCSNYPECSYKRILFQEENTENNNNNNEKVLGIDEITQSEILLKKGPYGFYLEKEVDGKKKRASLPAKISPDNVNLEFASSLLNLPKAIGKHPTINEEIFVKLGRYGPYLECKKKFYALKDIEKINLNLDEAIDLINNYKPKDSKKKR